MDDFDDVDELDENLMLQFSESIESAINDVIGDNLDKEDTRLELLTTLISFSAQLSQDLGITEDKFSEIAIEFYKEAEESLAEAVVNDDFLIKAPSSKKRVLN
jgi:hypothetical protein